MSDPAGLRRQVVVTLKKIDRIDNRGNILEHLTIDERTTICGLEIWMHQAAAGNGSCRRCARILVSRSQISALATSSSTRS